MQSYIVLLKEIKLNKETKLVKDSFSIQKYILYKNQWPFSELKFSIDHQFEEYNW